LLTIIWSARGKSSSFMRIITNHYVKNLHLKKWAENPLLIEVPIIANYFLPVIRALYLRH